MAWKLLRKPLELQDLLLNILLFALSAGLAVYLGAQIRWGVYLIGQMAMLSLHLAAVYTRAYFTLDAEWMAELAEFFKLYRAKRVGEDLTVDRPQFIYLLAALPFLTIFVISLLSLIQQGVFSLPLLLILLLIFALWGAYAVPPLLLGASPYRDLVLAALTIILLPAFSLLLQRGEVVDLLVIFALPLLLVYLALRIALDLEDLPDDEKQDRKTMLTALGWERGMRLHNLFLLLAYAALGVSSIFFRLPWELLWPCLISLPFALAQIAQMMHIHGGAKPNWKLLRFNARTTFFLLLYLILFSLWVAPWA